MCNIQLKRFELRQEKKEDYNINIAKLQQEPTFFRLL